HSFKLSRHSFVPPVFKENTKPTKCSSPPSFFRSSRPLPLRPPAAPLSPSVSALLLKPLLPRLLPPPKLPLPRILSLTPLYISDMRVKRGRPVSRSSLRDSAPLSSLPLAALATADIPRTAPIRRLLVATAATATTRLLPAATALMAATAAPSAGPPPALSAGSSLRSLPPLSRRGLFALRLLPSRLALPLRPLLPILPLLRRLPLPPRPLSLSISRPPLPLKYGSLSRVRRDDNQAIVLGGSGVCM
ncbi:hypothetical protein QBC35DRAFT_546304, partial [Podospora australis]